MRGQLRGRLLRTRSFCELLGGGRGGGREEGGRKRELRLLAWDL